MDTDAVKLIERLKDAGTLSGDEWVFLISKEDDEDRELISLLEEKRKLTFFND